MQEQAATIRGQGDGEDSIAKFQEKQAADITEVKLNGKNLTGRQSCTI